MKKLFIIALGLALCAAMSVSCSKDSSKQKELSFVGKWYVLSIEMVQDVSPYEHQTINGSGVEYWNFKVNGKVVIDDPNMPSEVSNGNAERSFSYDAENKLLTVDEVFKYKLISLTSADDLAGTMILKSDFPEIIWEPDWHLVINLVRNKATVSDQ